MRRIAERFNAIAPPRDAPQNTIFLSGCNFLMKDLIPEIFDKEE